MSRNPYRPDCTHPVIESGYCRVCTWPTSASVPPLHTPCGCEACARVLEEGWECVHAECPMNWCVRHRPAAPEEKP